MSCDCDNFRMMVDNQLDEFELSAIPGAIAEELGLLNILDEQREYVFRSPVITDTDADFSVTITGNRTDSRVRTADGFAISRHNMTGTYDSYRLRLFKKGVLVFDSGEIGFATLIPKGIFVMGVNYFAEPYDPAGLDQINNIWFSAVSYDSFELTVTKRPSQDPYREYIPYIDLGMCFLGKYLRPEYNFSWGNALSWHHGLTYTRTAAHSLVTEGGGDPYRSLQLNCEYMTDRDRNLFSPNIRRTMGKPVLIAAYPETTDRVRSTEYTMIAKVDEGNPWNHNGYQQHGHVFDFSEI